MLTIMAAGFVPCFLCAVGITAQTGYKNQVQPASGIVLLPPMTDTVLFLDIRHYTEHLKF